MVDRRAGRIPQRQSTGWGLVAPGRNKDGRWRRKRSDAGHAMVVSAPRPIRLRVVA